MFKTLLLSSAIALLLISCKKDKSEEPDTATKAPDCIAKPGKTNLNTSAYQQDSAYWKADTSSGYLAQVSFKVNDTVASLITYFNRPPVAGSEYIVKNATEYNNNFNTAANVVYLYYRKNSDKYYSGNEGTLKVMASGNLLEICSNLIPMNDLSKNQLTVSNHFIIRPF